MVVLVSIAGSDLLDKSDEAIFKNEIKKVTPSFPLEKD